MLKTFYLLSKIVIIGLIITLFTDCSKNRKVKALNQIQRHEVKVMDVISSDNIKANLPFLNSQQKLYQNYIAEFDHDSTWESIVMKSSEIYYAQGNYLKALDMLDMLDADGEYYEQSLWVKAMIYEQGNNDIAHARKMYEEILIRFPNGKFSTSAKKSLELMNRNLLDVVHEFEN